MKATITFVAMVLTAWAVSGPQRGFAQYGPAPYGPAAFGPSPYGPGQLGAAPQGVPPYGPPPSPMGPGAAAPYAVQPAMYSYPSMPNSAMMGPAMMGGMPGAAPMAPPPGYGPYPGALMAYQQPAPGAPVGPGPALPPPGAYGGSPYAPPGAPYYTPGDGAGPGYGAPEGGYGDGYVDATVSGDPALSNSGCDSCGIGCGGGCGFGAGLAPVFFGAETLLWIRHGQNVPALVSTSPAGALPDAAGVLDQGGIVVFGNDRIEDGFQPGVRLTGGVWLDALHEVSLGGRIFVLGTDETEFSATSPTGQPIIARPFLNVGPGGGEDAFVVAFDEGDPMTLPRSGQLDAVVTSDLWGGDITTSVMLSRGTGYRIDLLAGYQYYRIDESIQINSTTIQGSSFPDNIPDQTTLTVNDLFDTQNEFHGGALGLLTELQQGCFSLKLLGRLALGNMQETVRVAGTTVITPPPPAMGAPFPPVVFDRGILAQPSNIGTDERDRTVVSPEVGITLGYNFTQNVTFTLGYSFIYWTHVAQAGDQIDRAVDLTQALDAPSLHIKDTDFWVMGVNGGLEWRY